MKNKLTIKDYIYCNTCGAFVDFWKYGHNLEDAGHHKCNWRYVTPKELKNLVANCNENGCFDEKILGISW